MRGLRPFTRAALAGGLLALPIEVALLLAGAGAGGGLFGYEPLGDVFDAQGRALAHGRWDVPQEVIKIEGFVVGGRTYTYFGPVPALLRLPVVAVTDVLDGRLTRVSLLLAWAVTLAFATRFAWRARVVLRGDGPLARGEGVAVAAWVFVVGAASSVTYLASRPSVFHEAIAWGVALSLVGMDAVLSWWRDPARASRLAAATLAASAALLTRASVGSAPAIALMVFGLIAARRRWWRVAASAAVAAALPAVAYVAVNHAKFDTLVTVPFDKHLVSIHDQHRRDVLDANSGTIQGPQFLPTTVLHYVRPDALRLDGRFPWIDFPPPAVVVGGVVMDKVDVASSVPSSMPLLTVVAALGAVAVVRDRRLHAFGVAAFASAACLVVTLAIGFVAHRYTADAVPLLVVLGAIPATYGRRRAQNGVGMAAVVVSVAITAALTIQFQQHYGFLTAPDLRARLARAQLALPGERPTYVRGGTKTPVAKDRTFLVVGDCDGLYRSDGEAWQPVERTAATGRQLVTVTAGDGEVEVVPGITMRRAGRSGIVLAHGDQRGRVLRVDVDNGDTITFEVTVDPLLGFLEVRHHGELVLDDYVINGPPVELPPPPPPSTAHPAHPAPLCERVVAEGQPAGRRS